jgi:hypothetical protein
MGVPSILQHSLLVLQVRAIIEYAVQTGSFVHYVPLAKATKTFSGGKDLALALASIMEEDQKAGRPLTCALVVSSINNHPGDGFFVKARALGYQFKDGETFWKAQCQALGIPLP